MNLSIVGSGYVGTIVVACFIDLGHDAVNIDINEAVVETINADKAPIHEEELTYCRPYRPRGHGSAPIDH